jgi:hypothetical protein
LAENASEIISPVGFQGRNTILIKVWWRMRSIQCPRLIQPTGQVFQKQSNRPLATEERSVKLGIGIRSDRAGEK